MPIILLFVWLIVWMLAKGYEKFKEEDKRRRLDENPYYEFKSEKWLAENGLTKEQVRLHVTMRKHNKFGTRLTPEEMAKWLKTSMYYGDLSHEERLKLVEDNWYCMKEIDEKPEYKFDPLGRS